MEATGVGTGEGNAGAQRGNLPPRRAPRPRCPCTSAGALHLIHRYPSSSTPFTRCQRFKRRIERFWKPPFAPLPRRSSSSRTPHNRFNSQNLWEGGGEGAGGT
ncbi:hypothetical protein JIQ42_06896 [Leishmania sp. Namibia]|uniref:hypothetical protein n=1 Tax=Leishmania sp. Namibia TaxID=2802991 RepID=UPI001B5869D5|nr:hypothetical protein JIQ42_06896 [Leishmania sp. Namibia]